jgi:hypothetical protein
MRLSIDLEFDNFNQLLDFIHTLSKNQTRVVDLKGFASTIVMDGRRSSSGENWKRRGGRYSEGGGNNHFIPSEDISNGHPPTQRDTFKLKKFFQIFNSMTTNDNNGEVDRTIFLGRLVEDGKFTIEEAKQFIERGIENGQITIKEGGVFTRTGLSL